MAATPRIQEAKLRPPATAENVVPRPRLEARLDECFGRRLTTLVAGAGYGKSTALAAWTSDLRFAWLTVTADDRRATTLGRGLAAALDRATGLAGTFGTALDAHATDPKAQAEVLGALLAEGLARRLEHDLVLVVDDVHELPWESPSARLLDSLCRQAPPTLHLVLASRAEPPFPVARLQGRGEMLEIGPSELAFDEAEVATLLAGALGDDAAELATAVQDATAGWPAAVRLALEVLRPLPPTERAGALSELRNPRGPLFSYLAEEVVERESEPMRELIRCVAPFELIDVELCETLGIEDAAEKLESLRRRGLFLQELAGDRPVFALHTLVREFARERMPLSAARATELHRHAAGVFAERGDVAAALRSAVAAGDFAAAASLLADHGDELLAQGEADTVVAAAHTLPPDARTSDVEVTIGDAHASSGQWDVALTCYARAAGQVADLPPRLAWRMGRMHFDQGRLDEALALYARGRPDGSHPRDDALLLAWSASAHWSKGDVTTCLELGRRALELAGRLDEPTALAVAHNVLMLAALGGEPAAGDLHFREGLAAAERAADPQLIIRLRANRASQLQVEGAFDEELDVLGPAIELAEATGSGLALAFPLLKRGEVNLCLGRLDQAVADLEAALSIYRRFGSSRVVGPLVNLGEVYLLRGDIALARSVLEDAVRAARQTEDAQALLYGQALLAKSIAPDDPDRAAALAAEAVSIARNSGKGLDFALLASGWVALVRGAREDAVVLATEAAAHVQPGRHNPALAEAILLRALAEHDHAAIASRLDEASRIWREAGNGVGAVTALLVRARLANEPGASADAARLERRLESVGIRVSAAAGAAGPLACLPPDRPPALEVRSLGSFAVLRHGQPTPISTWKSRKSRELLKILIARRGRPVARDVIAEALWPGVEPAKVANRLSVALSTLRSVLDPDSRFSADHFVAGDRATIELRAANVVIDAERFARDAEEGLALRSTGKPDAAVERLEDAEVAYAGDFLEEDAYADWAVARREELRSLYIDVARALAEIHIASGDTAPATRYLLRVIERDPYDERAHLDLVRCRDESGGHGEARRAYRRYVERMEELGVEPAPYPASP